MAENKTVSVALAAFNGEKYIREQLLSILNQTRPVDEIIIVDDNSTDNTVAISFECFDNFKNAKILVNKNRLGVGGNFSKALENCTGEYILLCDQDDVWEVNKVERLLSEIQEASLVYSDALLIDENGFSAEKTLASTHPYIGVTSSDPQIIQKLIHDSFIFGCTCLIRADLLNGALPIPLVSRNHDWWLACMAARSSGIRYVPETLTRYRIHSNSFSQSKDKAHTLERVLRSFSAERKGIRKINANALLGCVQAMQASKLNFTKEERAAMANAEDYARALLKGPPRIAAGLYTWQHRKLLFPRETYLRQFLLSISRAFS